MACAENERLLREDVDSIAADLAVLARGGAVEHRHAVGDTVSTLDEYFDGDSVLVVDFTNRVGQFEGADVWFTWGGPNVVLTVDVETGTVEGTWGASEYSKRLDETTAQAVYDWAEGLFYAQT